MKAHDLNEVESLAMRRLLFQFARSATSREEFDRFLSDLQLLMDVPEDLLRDVTNAFNHLQATPSASTTNNSTQLPTVVNPYAKKKKAATPWTRASGEYASPQDERKKPAAMKIQSGPGRKKGTANKPGHKAGGNRKDAKHTRPIAGQCRLNSFILSGDGSGRGGDSGGDGGDGDGDGDSSDSESEDDENEIRLHREKLAQNNAVKELKRYAESFPNGSADMSINAVHHDKEEEEDDDDESDITDRKRRACLPAKGSAIDQYLTGIRQKVQQWLSGTTLSTPLNSINITNTSWIAPPMNPARKLFVGTADPSDFYVSDAFVFLWDPLLQYPGHMPSKVVCPICFSTDTKCDGHWTFRPYHWWDKRVYVYHRSCSCNSVSCKATWPTIRPDFLATLPTMVADQFPFISPTERGPGVYGPMLTMMKELFPSSVMIGKFAKVINVLLHVNFAQTHVSYLDAIHHWHNQPSAVVDCRVPAPFSPFADMGGYGGFELKDSLLKVLLRAYMKGREGYMQASAQTANDSGLSTDDSHKQAKHCFVTVGQQKVRPFTTTYTCMSLHGLPVLSLFKPTKSVDELREIIPNYCQVRANVGQSQLLRLEGDNAAGDTSLLLSAAPSLLQDVEPYQEETGLPRVEISIDDYVYVNNKSALADYTLGARDHVQSVIDKHGTCRVSVDTEFSAEGLHVVAIAIEGHRPAVLVHPYDWGNTFEPNMKNLLELDSILVIGCSVITDVHKLRQRFGIR